MRYGDTTEQCRVLDGGMRSIAKRSTTCFLTRTEGDRTGLLDLEDDRCKSGICVTSIAKRMIARAAACAPGMGSWFQFDDHGSRIHDFWFFAHRLSRFLVEHYVGPVAVLAHVFELHVANFSVGFHEVVEGSTILSGAQDDVATRAECNPVAGV